MKKISTLVIILITLLSCEQPLRAQNIADISGSAVRINTGEIEAYISGGKMLSLNLVGKPNLLANSGYGYFSYNDNNGFFSPSGLTPKVTVNNEEIADIYFEDINNFIVEMHYVFKKGESGFYTYFVISDNDLAFKVIGEIRFAVRVDKDIFDKAWTVEEKGAMIHPDDLVNSIREVQDATYQLADSSIYTKYDWSVYRNVDSLHGLFGNGYGIWNIEADDEYVNGGPNMQDLTLHGTHTTPILLTSFHTSHYGNAGVALKAEYLDWSKIWGPAFIYINSGTDDEMLEDAKQKAAEKKAEWPYQWLDNPIYPLERGELTGTLKMLGKGTTDSAMVVLSKPPASWYANTTNWQKQPYDYIFSAEADESGNFKIDKIRPGVYDFYAYTQKGKLVDELKIEGVEIGIGQNDLGDVDWEANDREHTIFQIGESNYKSNEFGLADLPRLYGRWNDTPDFLEYEVGISNDREDWFFCQRENTDWDIHFDITNKDSLFDPVVRVAFAGADAAPHLDVILNDEKIGYVRLGSDSGIRRSSLSGGKRSEVSFEFDRNILKQGRNTMRMSCYGSASEYKGLMYDAILLEADKGTPIVNTEQSPDDYFLNIYERDRSVVIENDFQDNSLVNIYTLHGGQLIHQSEINQRRTVIPINRPGVYVVEILNHQKFYKRKIILF